MWELWECQNWLLDGFLSWKMVSELQKAGKRWAIFFKSGKKIEKRGFGPGLG